MKNLFPRPARFCTSHSLIFSYVSHLFYFISRILVLLCLRQFLSTYFTFMQTHTITLAVPAAPLTGNIHTEHIVIPKKAEEITVNNLGSRIMTITGNSKKRTAIIITPGNDIALSQ